MQTSQCGAPNLLLILLGPMLLAVGRAALESQGEETTELLLPPVVGILVAPCGQTNGLAGRLKQVTSTWEKDECAMTECEHKLRFVVGMSLLVWMNKSV